MYSGDEYERRMVIKQMKPLGFSLEEMVEILSALATQKGEGSGKDAAGTLAGFLEKAVYQRAKMARNLAQADEFIQRLRGKS